MFPFGQRNDNVPPLPRTADGEIDYDDQTPAGFGNYAPSQKAVDSSTADEIDKKLGLETISVRVSSELAQGLRELAGQQRIPVGALLRKALSHYLVTQTTRPCDVEFKQSENSEYLEYFRSAAAGKRTPE